MRTVALIVGTRPECIKMAPLYFELMQSKQLRPILVATAQHRQMLDQTLAVFGLRPDVDLNLMQPGQGLPDLTARVLTSVHSWITMARPDAVLVQGDTTTVLGSALAAFYANVPVGHVEAGLRTDDMRAPFPEEMNRRLTAPLVRWNFCPTEQARENLLSEAIDDASCTVTGNTVVDALLWTRARLQGLGQDAEIIARLGVPPAFAARYLADPKARWLLVTGHRRDPVRTSGGPRQRTQLGAEPGLVQCTGRRPQPPGGGTDAVGGQLRRGQVELGELPQQPRDV